jgi:hypothetical protein
MATLNSDAFVFFGATAIWRISRSSLRFKG